MVRQMVKKGKKMSYWSSMFYLVIGVLFAVLGVFVSMPVNFSIGAVTTALGVVTFIFGFLNMNPEF